MTIPTGKENEMESGRTCRILSAAAALLVLLALWPFGEAAGVPGFSRQTSMSCNQCHTMHGGPVPNFTMTGKKFRALGYRVPHTRTAIQSGKKGDKGERMYLPLFSYLSFRLQGELLTAVRSPVTEEWGELASNPTSRVSWFFTGPISDNIGLWNEWYIIPLGSEEEEWSLGLASFDELDLRYIINPDNPKYTIGLAMTNQGIEELMGFGPFPVYAGGGEILRGSVRGYAHPNQGSFLAYGWMYDRFIWAAGANTGDDNLGWDYSNAVGQIAYAFRNGNDHELWLNLFARTGNDVIPLVTENYVPTGGRDWAYEDAIPGISGTRPDDAGPYLAADVDNATSASAEVRWSSQDWRGSHSGEAVLRFGYNTEEYRDGAGTDINTIGFTVIYGWKHTYYVKPYFLSWLTYEFTDHTGAVWEIDTVPAFGVNFGMKPKENFLVNLDIQNLQVRYLDREADDGGILTRLYLDYLL